MDAPDQTLKSKILAAQVDHVGEVLGEAACALTFEHLHASTKVSRAVLRKALPVLVAAGYALQTLPRRGPEDGARGRLPFRYELSDTGRAKYTKS